METDKIIDQYGNRKCSKCGTHYGKECQKCCEHKVELEKDYDYGMIIICNKCQKEFSLKEFNDNFAIVKRT